MGCEHIKTDPIKTFRFPVYTHRTRENKRSCTTGE